jgi:hypothetical protein
MADCGLFLLAQQFKCSKIHFVTGATPTCNFICLLGRSGRGRNVMVTEKVLRIGVRGINVLAQQPPPPTFLFHQGVGIAWSLIAVCRRRALRLRVYCEMEETVARSVSPISLLFLHVSGNLPSPWLKTLQHEGVETGQQHVNMSRGHSSANTIRGIGSGFIIIIIIFRKKLRADWS